MLPAHIVGDVSSIRLSAFLFVIGIVLVVFVVVIVSSVVVVFIVVVVIIVLKCGSLKSWRKNLPALLLPVFAHCRWLQNIAWLFLGTGDGRRGFR